jgi:(p)ppGpp synthase/HD superfamily hydrolase
MNFLINTSPLVQKAFDLAIKAHHGQKRRGGADYITHCVDVADRFTDPTDVAIALLHDVLEKTDVTYEDLESHGIPEEVRLNVSWLTKSRKTSYELYIEFVASYSERARKIKLADIFCNLNDQPTPNQIRKYAKALLVLVPETNQPTK